MSDGPPADGQSVPNQEMVFDDAFGYWVPAAVQERPSNLDERAHAGAPLQSDCGSSRESPQEREDGRDDACRRRD